MQVAGGAAGLVFVILLGLLRWEAEASALSWVSQPNIYQKKGARTQEHVVFVLPKQCHASRAPKRQALLECWL